MLRPTKPQIKRRAEGRGVGQLNTIFPIMSPLMKSVFRALLVALLFVVKSAVAQVTITSPAVVGTSPFQITYTVNKPTSYQNWYSPNPVPTFSLVEGVGSVTSAGYVTPTGQTGFIRIRVQLPSYQYLVRRKGNVVRTITEPAWEGEFTIGIVKGLESMRLSSDPGLFSFVIPDGVKGMELHLWGCPGGAAGNDSMAYQQYAGGHGGYVRAVFSRPVVGSTVEIIVGQGGTSGDPKGNNNDSGGRSGAASLARMNGSLIAVAGGGAGAGNRKGFYSVNRVLPNTNPYDYWNGGYSVGGTPASSIRTTAPEAGGLQIGYGYQDGVSVNPTGISGDWIATGGSSYVSPLAVKSEFKRGTPYPYPFDLFGASGNNPGYSGDYVGRRTASSHGGFLVVFSYDDPSPNQTVTFSISGTAREWSGSPQAVSVTSNPIGVPLLVTYNGSTTAQLNDSWTNLLVDGKTKTSLTTDICYAALDEMGGEQARRLLPAMKSCLGERSTSETMTVDRAAFFGALLDSGASPEALAALASVMPEEQKYIGTEGLINNLNRMTQMDFQKNIKDAFNLAIQNDTRLTPLSFLADEADSHSRSSHRRK